MSKPDIENISQHEAQILAATLRRVRSNAQPNVFDIHHPETSPSWPRYQHQEFPKIVYHPLRLDPRIENENRATTLRNQRNPNLAQLDLQHSQPMTKKVNSPEELEAARKEGWLLKPPFLVGQSDLEADDFLMSTDPLAAAVADPAGKTEAKPTENRSAKSDRK